MSILRISSLCDHVPEPLGVNAGAPAALGDKAIPLTGSAFAGLGVKLGVNEGDSTLRTFFGLHCSAQAWWADWSGSTDTLSPFVWPEPKS